jgi:hypothetical protein
MPALKPGKPPAFEAERVALPVAGALTRIAARGPGRISRAGPIHV